MVTRLMIFVMLRALVVWRGGPVTKASVDALRSWMGLGDDVDERNGPEEDSLDDIVESRGGQKSREDSEGEKEHHEGFAGSPILTLEEVAFFFLSTLGWLRTGTRC